MSSTISLKDRHTDATQKLILATAIKVLERTGFGELTVRAVASQAGMSERTVFRYFATRDEFLDAVASEAATYMQAPPPPETIEDLQKYPDRLYRAFEERSNLVRAVLHTEIFKRVRITAARDRWAAVEKLVDENLRHLSKKNRSRISTNINYFLSGTTWSYYRFHFELSLDESIASARSAIAAMLSQ